MAGRCAACLRPIATGEKFLLAETEVFHERCVAAGGIERSVGNRQKIAAARLKRDLADANILLDELRRQIRRQLDQHADATRQYNREVEQAMRIADEYKQLRDNIQCDYIAMTVARDTALRERDAARSEAALHQTLAAKASQATPATTEATAKDDRDATVQRFSLLELD